VTPADPRAGFTGHSATLCYTSPSDSSFLARLQQFYPPFYVGGIPAREGGSSPSQERGVKGETPNKDNNLSFVFRLSCLRLRVLADVIRFSYPQRWAGLRMRRRLAARLSLSENPGQPDPNRGHEPCTPDSMA